MRAILWFSILIATGFYITGPIVDPDLWWHITVGKWIVANLEIPVVDHWNMFAVGKPWRAYSWSNEVILAFVDARFGIYGLLTLKFFLSGILAFSLFYCLGKISKDWFLGGLLGMYATASCFNHFTLRPQSLVWVYLIWLFYLCFQIERDGLRRSTGIGLVLVMALWANTHLTTALGVAAAVGWLYRGDQKKIALWGGALCFLGTLFTPYLGGEWITFFSKTGHPFTHSAIAEFKPATVLQYSTGFVLLLVVLALLFLHKKPRMEYVPKALVCGIFLLGGLAVTKFLPVAAISICALIAVIWGTEGENRKELGNFAEAIERFRKLFDRIPKEGLSFVFLCAAVINVWPVWQNPVRLDITPVPALDFILEKQLRHPILNGFGKGGYVMYRLSNHKGELTNLVPIDGRTNVNPEEVWNEYYASLTGKHDWRKFIDRVQPETILWKTESPFTTLLLEDDQWCVVYRVGEKERMEERGYSVFVTRAYFDTRAEEFISEDCGDIHAALENAGNR